MSSSLATPEPSAETIREKIQERYGRIALERGGVQTAPPPRSGCCGPAAPAAGPVPAPAASKSCCGSAQALEQAARLGYTSEDVAIAPEGAELGLGCGNPIAIASIQPGETVVDLGSGGGFDCFLAGRRTGHGGHVVGVDMTPEMIRTARANARHRGVTNVEFRLGEIEHLPVADSTADLVISNCVINLSPDKPAVFREAHRILKPGGRLALADVVATAPLPDDLRADLAARVRCIAGAAHVDELRAMLAAAGFTAVTIACNESSRARIDQWSPGKSPGNYVVSALIEARR
jgi:SAM-dependent methyltransferase